MLGYSNIYEFQIHSNSLIRISKNEKSAHKGPFLPTITDYKYDVSFSFFLF